MSQRTDSSRYSATSILLHWTMLLLIAAVYASIELREFFPKGSDPRETLKSWHFMLGLAVFVLVWLRIGARLAWPAADEADAPPNRRRLADLTQLVLYGLMIGMPIAGWLILSAEAKPIPFFGAQLPPLIGEDPMIADKVEELHELGGTIGYVVIGLHAAAALLHHYVLRDGMLARMLPAKS